jgi:hypothetical protein
MTRGSLMCGCFVRGSFVPFFMLRKRRRSQSEKRENQYQ